MRAGWRLLFARMYKCGGREARVPPGGVKESNKREPGELQGPLVARRNLLQPLSSPALSRILRPVLLLGPRNEDSSRTKFQPTPAITARDYPLSFLALFVFRERGVKGEKVADVPRRAGRTEITRAGPDVYDRSEP